MSPEEVAFSIGQYLSEVELPEGWYLAIEEGELILRKWDDDSGRYIGIYIY